MNDPHPVWMYDEFKQVGIDYDTDTEVEKYDRETMQSRNLKEELEFIKHAIGIKNTHVVLELGAGTGELAIGLSPYCTKVVAADVSRRMIHTAMEKAARRNVSNVEFVCSGFLTTDAGENHYDAIVTQIALHHLPEFWKMIAIKKMYSALKSGGKLLLIDCILSFDVIEYVHHVNGYIEMVKKIAGTQKANEVVLNIKEEYPAFDWVIETMLLKAGFTIDKVSRFNGYIASFLCTT